LTLMSRLTKQCAHLTFHYIVHKHAYIPRYVRRSGYTPSYPNKQ
jgi:hypothetical protein